MLTGCFDKGGGGGSNSKPSTPPVTTPTPPPVTPPSSTSVFYDQPTLLANLPDMPSNAQEPYDSYVNATSKGNDQGSTKRLDLIRWYNAIRHADTSTPFRNFDGSARVYAEAPNFTKGQYRIGILSKPYAENHLDYYNFMRALFGAQRVYMSGYKQVSAQASSFSDLPGGHYPAANDATSRGYSKELFDAISFGRGSSNLQGGNVNRDWDYASATRLNRNSDLTGVWNESDGGNIAPLGHRRSFMHTPGKDMGAGLVAGFHSWQSWGADPMRNNGNLLGATEQKRIYDAYPQGRSPNGVQVWPSHGYFPFFALSGRNQSWGMELYSADVSAPSQDEAVTLRMEYFVHEQDGDLSTLSNPVASIEVSDIKGSGINAGGKGAINAQGVLDYDGPDFITAQAGATFGGGYHFSLDGSNFPTQFRMPQAWFAQMNADFSAASKPKYHTVRYTFIANGVGLRVKRPFYMNPTIGAPLVVQTTFFDPQKNTEATPPAVTPPVSPETPPVVTPPVSPETPPDVTPPVSPETPPVVTPPADDNDNDQTGTTPSDPDGDHGTAPDVEVPPPVSPPAPTFAEPTGVTDDEVNAVAFYDIDGTGQPRAVRHDLAGSLPAMVQFVQSHSVDPAGNAAKNMPTLTSEREALLLITPDPSLGKLQTLTLNATLDGQPLPALTLRSPNELFRSDYSNTDGRPDLTYSRRAWSVLLPWDWVKPGLSLSLTDEQGRNGQLAAEGIEFAAPAELVLHTIRVGMLTAPPKSNSHWLSLQPVRAATDYFQTIPVARITAAQYEDVQFNRVMVGSGAIYDVDGASHNPAEPTFSPVEGGVYSGDMRGDTGKSTVSVGTNLANYGVTSSSMVSQIQPQLFQSVVAHHAAGLYSNGLQTHGLSGGNGMLTLWSSQGNEFSHEIGHHFGLGHYPGSNLPPKSHFWSNHHADSGWGLIGYRKRLRANVHWTAGVTANQQGEWSHQFLDLYSYAPDAMAGGSFASKLSRYTHYTGFSTKTGIQPRLDRAIPSSTSSTGYLKWNASTRQMDELAPPVQNNSNLFYNGAKTFAKPQRLGVPVFTILGGYVPETGSAVLYPALRSNWGNVFNLPAPVANATTRQCWLSVDYANGSNQRIAVAGQRLGSVANKLHIQLAEDQQPTFAKLFCQAPADPTPTELASLALPQNLPPMPAPVVVGKEAGYSALRSVEMPELDTALRALASKTVLVLSGTAQLLYDSYSDNPDGLSAEARAVFDRYQDQQQRALRLNRWINVYRTQLEQGDPAADAALRQLLTTLNLNSAPLLPAAVPIKNGTNCLKAAGTALQVLPAANCSGAASETWIIDARGAVHSGADTTLCLTNSSGLRLSPCDLANNGQSFDLSQALTLKQGSACMDLAGSSMSDGTGEVLMYGCHGGGNQRWTGLTANPDNLLLPLVSRRNLGQIVRLDQANAAP